VAGKPVLILVGSESDRERVAPAMKALDEAAVGYDFVVSSAHRNAEETARIAKQARSEGYRVIIAAAGLALYAIAQLPPGCPVGTVGIGMAKNAALLAVRILNAS
jgi:5-(carboxyamino)imidazole ribonucleotide mutase